MITSTPFTIYQVFPVLPRGNTGVDRVEIRVMIGVVWVGVEAGLRVLATKKESTYSIPT